MTRYGSHDDIEEIVRRTLSSQAGAAPSVDDGVAERVIHRGRVVRRRRRVAGAAAGAVASLAVVGGVWGVFAPHGTETMPAAPSTSSSTPVSADRAPAAVLPRADLTGSGVVLKAAGHDVPLGADVRSVRSVVPAGKQTVVLASTAATAADDSGTQTLLVVDAAGTQRVVASGAIRAAAVSPDGTKIAYVGGPAGSGAPQTKVRDLASGQLVASDESQSVGSVASLGWDGADVVVVSTQGQDRSVIRWTPGGNATSTPSGTVPVAGTTKVVVAAAPGRDCLRAAGSGSDLVCGSRLDASVSPDGRSGLVHVGGVDGGSSDGLYRLDPAAGTVTALPKAGDLAASGAAQPGDWRHVAWTPKGTPLVRVAPRGDAGAAGQWRAVDLASGASSTAPLPAGATRTISW